MSIEATAWALGITGLQDSTERVILLGLANHAAADGTASWPSVATLAEYAVCSPRTVHRRLRDLEGRGLIRRGDQGMVDHLPADRRPVVYDLPTGMSDWHPVENGVSPVTRRGVTGGTDGVTRVADKPSMNHPEPSNPPKPPEGGEQGVLIAPEQEPTRTAASVYPDAFETLWSTWPKRRTDTAGKKAAHTAWARAVLGTAKRPARVDAATVQAAVEAYAADPNLPDPETEAQFIPNLTTWLNQDRWENGPQPARAGSRSRPQAGDTHRAMHRSHDAAEAYRALEASGYYDSPPAQPRQAAPLQLTRRTA